MQGREALDDTAFGQRYFPPSHAAVAARMRQIFTQQIAFDFSRLHPDDRWVEDIQINEIASLDLIECIMEIEEEFGVPLPDSVSLKMRTFRDMVDYVVAHSGKEAM